MVLKLLKRLVCDHDFHVPPVRCGERWHYYCHHGCGKVKRSGVFEYDYNNVADERKAGR